MDKYQINLSLQSLVIVMSIIFILALFLVFFFTIYQKRLLQQQKAHQKIESEYQKSLLKAIIESQEKERMRIAKELHDDIGAMLTTSKLYASRISSKLSIEDLNTVKEKTVQLIEDMIHSSRRISQDLRPVILEKLGLIEGVQNLVHTLNETKRISVIFEHDIPNISDKSMIINLYRIIQELISNTIKHAEASSIEIKLSYNSNKLELNYHDNGKGINIKKLKYKKGIGMKNVESRVSALDGQLEFQESSTGIKLLMEFPFITESENNKK